VPSLYDISGSANFYNKTDYGFTVHRKVDSDNVMQNQIEVHFQKIKYKHLGKQGVISLDYDYVSGRFNQSGRDLSNWLIPEQKKEIPIMIDFYESNTNQKEEEPPF
jgi:twinkle protein